MGDTLSYEQLLKEHGSLTSPPPVGSMKKMLESLKAFGDVARLRSETCDKGMREYSKKRKELSETLRQREFAAKQAEEDRKQKEQKKNKQKKEQAQEQELKQEKEQEEAAARPLAVGAHALAPQDGSAPEGKLFSSSYFIYNCKTSYTTQLAGILSSASYTYLSWGNWTTTMLNSRSSNGI